MVDLSNTQEIISTETTKKQHYYLCTVFFLILVCSVYFNNDALQYKRRKKLKLLHVIHTSFGYSLNDKRGRMWLFYATCL